MIASSRSFGSPYTVKRHHTAILWEEIECLAKQSDGLVKICSFPDFFESTVEGSGKLVERRPAARVA